MRTRLFQSKQTVVRLLGDYKEGEQFKVEMWVRIHPGRESRELTLWASSQAIIKDMDTLHEARIEHESNYIAVQTFAEGRCIGPPTEEQLAAVGQRRWCTFISVPIWLDGGPWLHLPVGTIAIMSTRPKDSSKVPTLSQVSSQVRNAIAKELREAGTALLTPGNAAL